MTCAFRRRLQSTPEYKAFVQFRTQLNRAKAAHTAAEGLACYEKYHASGGIIDNHCFNVLLKLVEVGRRWRCLVCVCVWGGCRLLRAPVCVCVCVCLLCVCIYACVCVCVCL